MLAAASSAWGGLLAVDPNSSSSWVGGAAALTLLTIAIGFNVRNQVKQARDLRAVEVARRRDQRVCNYQLSVLVEVLDASGTPMPAKFWDIPDDAALDIHEAEARQRRRRMFGFLEEDDDSQRGWVTSIFLGTVFSVLAAFAIFALVLNGFILQPLHDLETNGAEQRCVSSLSADQFLTIIYSLRSTPDSDQRDFYSDLAAKASERLRNRDHICSDGKPDVFVIPRPSELAPAQDTPTTTVPPST